MNDHCIDPGIMQGLKFGNGIGKLVREDEDIQGHIGFDSVIVEKGDDFGQFLVAEIVSPHACIEAGEAKKNGIRTIGHGGPQAIPISRR